MHRIVTAVVVGAVLTAVMIAAGGLLLLQSVFGTSNPSANALADIPADYLILYRQAATLCPSLDWSVLAAIGKIETDHGRSPLPGVHSGTNSAGAGGPMQFLAATFAAVIARHALPPGGATPPSLYNPHDAIDAAAFYLCDNGASHNLRTAIFAYNHAIWYVDEVLDQAAKYASAATVGVGGCAPAPAPNSRAAAAIAFACRQLGTPYVWGGNGAELTELPNGQTQVTGGFDCSGLTKAAYAAASIQIPRTAQLQYDAGPHVPASQPILPGDLVFFGSSPNTVTHVGIAISAESMIDAPDVGQVVKIEQIRRSNFIGATRPAWM